MEWLEDGEEAEEVVRFEKLGDRGIRREEGNDSRRHAWEQ